MNKELLDYFSGDELAANVWESKYQVKDLQNNPLENTPDDMHKRLAKEFARIEKQYILRLESKAHCYNDLSECGKKYYHYGQNLAYDGLLDKVEEDIFNYFKNFKYIIPQGSIMSILGHPYKVGSLSNCFVIPAPLDSYGGILYTDEHLVQLMKRRGGVGTNLNNLRPTKAVVTNAAGTSTGVPSFSERYSNTTREVAQDGRRGALMLLLLCLHPDIFNFVKMKQDRTKVTGANVSTMLTDKFMGAVDNNELFLCRFPVEVSDEDSNNILMGLGYDWKSDFLLNTMYTFNVATVKGGKFHAMVINARELFDLIVEMAWENAEPGIAFIDRIINYSPEGVYEMFRPIASNPCGEQWLQAYDSCRLFAMNFFSIVDNPFTKDAKIDYEKLYEISYIQQRLADDLVDLEIEHIEAIINKIHNDPEPENIKEHELDLWINILNTCKAGRRTGCGFTGLGDMLAALGLKYDSEEAMKVIDKVMYMKMAAELDCTIDMGILRGTFEGWDRHKEYTDGANGEEIGRNNFYEMILFDFTEQCERMQKYGRRNVSWSTVAPTGTVSLMTQTTSGLEPLFSPYYFRKKKINPNDKESRVDFTDQNGDTWQEFPVLHPKFKDWINTNFDELGMSGFENLNNLNKEDLQKAFEKSPWYGSTANDIDWINRVKIQGIIQKYTTNAISSTINLPNDVTKEEVGKIYHAAYHAGLKGVTVYRDGCRTGVISTETSKVSKDKFGYTEAVKRPKELEADYYYATSKGKKYAVIVGLLDSKPYEIFAFENPVNEEHLKGKIIKIKKGHYSFISPNYTIENLQLSSEHTDERLLTRWVSTLLRHGANPKFVIEQTEKSEVGITNFVKVICRVLKKYVIDGEVSSSKCPECKEGSLIYEEGCKKCNNCGYSAC